MQISSFSGGWGGQAEDAGTSRHSRKLTSTNGRCAMVLGRQTRHFEFETSFRSVAGGGEELRKTATIFTSLLETSESKTVGTSGSRIGHTVCYKVCLASSVNPCRLTRNQRGYRYHSSYRRLAIHPGIANGGEGGSCCFGLHLHQRICRACIQGNSI